MTNQERKEVVARQVRMVKYRDQSVRNCVDYIESIIETLTQEHVKAEQEAYNTGYNEGANEAATEILNK